MSDAADGPGAPIGDPRAWLETNVARIKGLVTRWRAAAGSPGRTNRSCSRSSGPTWPTTSTASCVATRGRGSLNTYLRVVIERLVLDMRVTNWGKWRPSARARRLGAEAVLFEQLTVRDGQHRGSCRNRSSPRHGRHGPRRVHQDRGSVSRRAARAVS